MVATRSKWRRNCCVWRRSCCGETCGRPYLVRVRARVRVRVRVSATRDVRQAVLALVRARLVLGVPGAHGVQQHRRLQVRVGLGFGFGLGYGYGYS